MHFQSNALSSFELRLNSDWVISGKFGNLYFYLGLNYLPDTSSLQMVPDYEINFHKINFHKKY